MLKPTSLIPALLYLLALTGAVPASAAEPVNKPFAHEITDLKPDPAVRFGRLDNGVRYAILKNARPEGRASLLLGVMTGSLQETEEQRGLAHFLEHLAFNGSEHFPPGTLVEYFQRLGMSFGGDTNASTNFDRTIYQLELPDTGTETLKQAFTLFADYAGGLLLEADSIDKERGIILAEMRDRDSQGLRGWLARMQFVAPDARFIGRLPIGTEDVIRNAKRERFVDFYNTWYRPENLVVVAVGDFDPTVVQAQITAMLGPVKARAPARPDPGMGTIAPPEKSVASFHHQPDAGSVSVGFDVVLPFVEEEDSAARRAQNLRTNIALALLNRRLGLLARQEGAEIVGGRAQETRMLDFLRVATLDVGCRESVQWRECLATGEQELRRALEYGFQEAELNEIVANVRNQLEQGVRMADARTSPQLAQGLLGSIIEEGVFTSPASNQALLEPVLEELTVKDCLAALRGLFGQGVPPALFVAGNVQIEQQDILAAYQASASQPVKANDEEEQAKFAYDVVAEPGAVAQRREVEDLGLTLLQFGNGVKLNVKSTDFEPGRIHVDVRVGGGILTAPRDKPGLPALLGRSFVSGGLGEHSVEQLSTILAGRNVGYRFGIGGDAFEFSGSTTPDDLLLQLQVLQAFITDPGYRPDALREFREGLDRMYTELSHAITGPQNTEIARLMAGNDPRFGLPAQSVLAQRNLEEAGAWLNPQLASGVMEVSIVGDLDVEQTIAAVARTFGALPERKPKPAYTAERQVSYPDKAVSRQFKVETELPRGVVDMRWPATDGRDVPVARRIGVLTSVFSDRLRVRLREEMGQAYSPGVRQQLSEVFPDYGFIVANASVAPSQARTVADTIREVAADMAANGITEDELKRAKEPILTQIHQSLQQNGYWMNGVISGVQEFPQRLDWHRSREADFRSIDVEEINALAKQYLGPQRAFEFIMLPAQTDEEAAPAEKAAVSGD